jgi:hypothetical protein
MSTGLRVFVYYNLHKHMWSVKALEGEHKGRVITHTRHLALMDCTFKVSEAGRQRVIRDRKKNVHAGIEGRMLQDSLDMVLYGNEQRTKVTYNPYKYDSFVDVDNPNRKILFSNYAQLHTDRTVEAFNPTVSLEGV